MRSTNTNQEILPLYKEDFYLFQDHQDARFDYPVHYHSEYELNLVLNACGKRIAGTSMEPYKYSDLALLGSGLLHAWSNENTENKARVVTLQFPVDFLSKKTLDRKVMHPVRDLLMNSAYGIVFEGSHADDLAQKLIHLNTLREMDGFLGFLSLLYDLAVAPGQRLLNDPASFGRKQHIKNEKLRIACDYIHTNYKNTDDKKRVSLIRLAEMTNMSPSAFSHFFKKHTYRSFSDYLTDLRIIGACRLLIETDKPVGEIAEECGFKLNGNFNRLFVKRKKVTPREYRNAARSRPGW